MRESSRLFLFPDINVWVALSYDRHVHHATALQWFEALAPTSRLFFCRLTQLGLLRLLSAPAVMGPDQAKSQQEAWQAYDHWLEDERVDFMDEPFGLEGAFRELTRSAQASPKDWADSYLVAFAQASRLTVVTFDRAFQNRAKDLVLLNA
ncbi:MAG TPA: TA system VapC family ribonuclease toxin [Candidatus Acidoferrum sp.]|nr:TA system VapC family ribonuclease toxin [Candidatus Acidoferrum sp.]